MHFLIFYAASRIFMCKKTNIRAKEEVFEKAKVTFRSPNCKRYFIRMLHLRLNTGRNLTNEIIIDNNKKSCLYLTTELKNEAKDVRRIAFIGSPMTA